MQTFALSDSSCRALNNAHEYVFVIGLVPRNFPRGYAEKILRWWSRRRENFPRIFLLSYSVTPSYHSHSKIKHQDAVYSVASRWFGHRFAAVVEPHGNAAGKAAAYFFRLSIGFFSRFRVTRYSLCYSSVLAIEWCCAKLA